MGKLLYNKIFWWFILTIASVGLVSLTIHHPAPAIPMIPNASSVSCSKIVYDDRCIYSVAVDRSVAQASQQYHDSLEQHSWHSSSEIRSCGVVYQTYQFQHTNWKIAVYFSSESPTDTHIEVARIYSNSLITIAIDC